MESFQSIPVPRHRLSLGVDSILPSRLRPIHGRWLEYAWSSPRSVHQLHLDPGRTRCRRNEHSQTLVHNVHWCLHWSPRFCCLHGKIHWLSTIKWSSISDILLDKWESPQPIKGLWFQFIFSIICSTVPVPSGIFIPVFKIGAALGRAVGEAMALWFPNGVRYGGIITPIIPGNSGSNRWSLFLSSDSEIRSKEIFLQGVTLQSGRRRSPVQWPTQSQWVS